MKFYYMILKRLKNGTHSAWSIPGDNLQDAIKNAEQSGNFKFIKQISREMRNKLEGLSW